jgi:acyl carrier protein
MYAAALEYPEEVFTPDVELEADLGIDSVKQTELLARVSEQYGIPPKPADFRLSDYNTLGRVADFVAMWAPAAEASAASRPGTAADGGVSNGAARTATIDRDDLFAKIVSVYAAALEYPEEVFTPDVALEADLGVDSVKQTELLARLADEFRLPDRPTDFVVAQYDTLRKVTDFVFAAMDQGASNPVWSAA